MTTTSTIRNIFNQPFLALTLVMSLILSGCEEEQEPVTPEVPQQNLEPVNVLEANSGFSHVYDDVRLLSSASDFQPFMDVIDFTLEDTDKLNIAYYSSQPSQQDDRVQNMRVSVDVSTGEKIALPTGADTLAYSRVSLAQKGRRLVLQQFRPYSNFFTYATEATSGFNKIEFSGDIHASVGPTPNPVGIPDLGYRFPNTNMAVGIADNGFAWFLTGIPNPTYTLSSTSASNFNIFNNSGKIILMSFLESDVFTYGNYKAIFVRTDSVIAYTINDERTHLIKDAAFQLLEPPSAGNFDTKRHYSVDGKILGIMIKDKASNKVWTFSYDFDDKELSQGLEAEMLDFSGVGSDIDLDEFGNVYYTGFAGNGSNTEGVSIYRKDVNGNVTTIGKDNLLKFGTVKKLKVLSDKVFIAVTGKQTGTSAYQLSFLKQD